ncbi:hypothetical protein [Actinacidiphila glaucinigra]|uniref:hypothetical protein n=2 Tax=Actinacidiphila glaucinigra TaxID=235986 RepID=UPI00117CED7E|nr:hypothetical protein [Actinacidiphila glaucinigra]
MSITVCLPGAAADRVDEAIADAMAPFEMDGTREWQLDIWDSWYITGGGAMSGGFNVLPGHERDPRLIRSRRWDRKSERLPNDFGWCAGGPRELLDFSASHEEARRLAAVAGTGGRTPPADPWQVYHDRAEAEFRAYNHRQVSADHRVQPLVKSFDAHVRALPKERYWYRFLNFFDPVVDVGRTERETFVEQQVASSLRTRNVLTRNCWWYEDGGPGIHGECHGPAVCRRSGRASTATCGTCPGTRSWST